jgi:hypothetical protein
MSCETLEDIAISCDNNVAGLKAFYLIEKSKVTGITLSSPGDEISAFTITASAKFQKWEFTKQSGSNFVESTKTNENGGDLTTQTITLNFNRREKTKRDKFILAGRNVDLVGIGVDNNGLNWYFGEVNGINMISRDGGSGENKSAKNGYTVVLTGEEPYEANTVTAAALAAVIE